MCVCIVYVCMRRDGGQIRFSLLTFQLRARGWLPFLYSVDTVIHRGGRENIAFLARNAMNVCMYTAARFLYIRSGAFGIRGGERGEVTWNAFLSCFI